MDTNFTPIWNVVFPSKKHTKMTKLKIIKINNRKIIYYINHKVRISRVKQYLLLCAGMLCLAACSGESSSGGSSANVAQPQAKASQAPSPMNNATGKTYRVFSEHSYIPFIMHDNQGGVSGFEYELLKEIAQREQLNLTFTPHTWEDLFATLTRNEADIVVSGLTITEERKQSMDFTDSHLETESVLLTKNPQILSFKDMAGKNITLQSGTTQKELVQKFQKGVGEIQSYNTTWLTVNDILINRADAAMGDSSVMNYYLKQYPKYALRIVADVNTPKEQLAFAIQKGNEELKGQLNLGLKKIKADGTYQKIHDKWFGKAS